MCSRRRCRNSKPCVLHYPLLAGKGMGMCESWLHNHLNVFSVWALQEVAMPVGDGWGVLGGGKGRHSENCLLFSK